MSLITKIAAVVAVLALAGGGYYFWAQPSAVDESSMTIQFGNNSWDALSIVELSPAGAGAFVSIPLPDGKLDPAEFSAYAIADGRTICTYDLRVTKVGGETGSYEGVNLCEETFYHFEEAGFE